MKFAGVVLRNIRSPLSLVEYEEVFGALLSGGIYLDELIFLPYDAPSLIASSYARLTNEYDGVFLVCDRVLCASAKRAVSRAAGTEFAEEYVLETQDCFYAVLPDGETGKAIAAREIVPRVNRRRRNSYARVLIRTMAAPQELVSDAITRARNMARGQLNINVVERFGDIRIEIIYDTGTPKMAVDEITRIFATELKDFIYSLDDTTVAERLVDALRLHRMKLSTAESFTGGGVGRAIVSVPGASDVFYEGLNTYDSDAKQERLGVSQYTIMQKGAVSDDTAYEMAAGLLTQGKCDIAVATTGIAGPKSDRSGLPVGLCFIAVGTKERVRVYRFQLAGDRETVMKTATNLALFYAYQEIS